MHKTLSCIEGYDIQYTVYSRLDVGVYAHLNVVGVYCTLQSAYWTEEEVSVDRGHSQGQKGKKGKRMRRKSSRIPDSVKIKLKTL